MYPSHLKCWLIKLSVCSGLVTSFGLASAQNLENRGTGEITLSDVSGRLSQSTSLQSAGISASITDFWPQLGLIEVNVGGYPEKSGFRTGLSEVKVSNVLIGNEKISFTGGAFTLAPYTLAYSFTALSPPSLTLSGFAMDSRGRGHHYRVFAGRELLMEGLYVPLSQNSGQDIFGGEATFNLLENLSLSGRSIWFSKQGPSHSSNDATGAELLQTLPSAISNMLDIAWKVSKPIQMIAQAGYSKWQHGVDTGWHKSLVGGLLWESDRLSAHSTYTNEPMSYIPVAGFYSSARKGFIEDFNYRPAPWLNTFGSWTVQQVNAATYPVVSQLSSASTGVGASLLLPWQTSLSAQYQDSNFKSNAAANNPASWQKANLVTMSSSRAFRRHTAHLNVSWLTTTASTGPLAQRSWQVQDDLNWKRFTITGGMRFQQTIGDTTTNGIYFSGGLRGSIKAFTFSEHFESGSDLASKTLLATSASRSEAFSCEYRLKEKWRLSAEIWRASLLTNLSSAPVYAALQNTPLTSQTLSNNQWTAYFKLVRQVGWGNGNYSSSDIARYAERATPRVGSIAGSILVAHPQRPPSFGAAVTILLDGFRRAISDQSGKYVFDNVAEGPHIVEIDDHSLPVDFMVENTMRQPATVVSSHATPVDFSVLATAAMNGMVETSDPELLKGFVARLVPGGLYTMVNPDGHFYFDGIAEGNYIASICLPGSSASVIIEPDSVRVTLRSETSANVSFKVVKRIIAIPIRTVQIAEESTFPKQDSAPSLHNQRK